MTTSGFGHLQSVANDRYPVGWRREVRNDAE